MSPPDEASTGASSSFESQPYGAPPTYAAFSPTTISASTPSRSTRRSTVLVHQKSPLLLATPPQITRALAYSHPFLLPLNTFVGLLTWSTGDAWQSFVLLCTFWGIVLYGDAIVKTAGPVAVGFGLIAGMYGRRYSPLSSSGWSEPARDAKDGVPNAMSAVTGDAEGGKGKATASEKQAQAKHRRAVSEVTNTKHQKTLDEIVETLKEFTSRCNVLLEPLLEMTDFLSTQRTPTSATTKPALIAMFVRLLVITPFWFALTMSPWRVITTRRVVLVFGTIILTWHARVLRVTRTILWRSASMRRLAAFVTGLEFTGLKAATDKANGQIGITKKSKGTNLQTDHKRSGSNSTAGVKFTFIIYENQRRWIGLGWTTSLFAYERSAWTDEHNNSVPQKADFELPDVEDGNKMEWRWVGGGRWRVDGVSDDHGAVDYDSEEGKNGWIYYDNKWQNGRRGLDGWGRWTRRRKWYRDAELVEVDETERPHEIDKAYANSLHSTDETTANPEIALPLIDESNADDASLKATNNADDSASLLSTSSRSSFWPPSLRRRTTDRSSIDRGKEAKRASEGRSDAAEENDDGGLGIDLELELQKQGKEGGQWGIGDEARMNLE